jgi:predicted RNA-binding protein YlxR (DUF448 family)
MLLVRLKDFEDKVKVMRMKRKLTGRDCYIENDMTKNEIYRHL